MRLKISHKTVLLFIYSILFFIVLYLHSNQIYLIAGVLLLIYFLLIILKKPESVLLLYLSSFLPIFYTFGYFKIESLNFIIIAFLVLISISASVVKTKTAPSFNKNILILIGIIFPIFLIGFINGSSIISITLLLRYVVYTFLPLVIVDYIKNKNDFFNLIDRAIILNSILIISFLILYLLSTYAVFKWKIESSIGLSFLCLMNISLLILRRPRSALYKILLGLSIILMIILFQRAFILATILYASWMVFSEGSFNKKFKITIITGLLILLVVPFTIPDARFEKIRQTELFTKNINNLESVRESENIGSIGIRLYLWQTGIRYTIQNAPIFGNGFNRFEEITGFEYPHNLIVDIFFCTGIVGLIVFLIFIFVFIILFFKNVNFRNSYEFNSLMGFVGSLFTVLLFSGGFDKSSFYIFIFIAGLSLFYKSHLTSNYDQVITHN